MFTAFTQTDGKMYILYRVGNVYFYLLILFPEYSNTLYLLLYE